MATETGGNFNWIAPLYDPLAFLVFGRQLDRAQTVFLPRIPFGASVLIVGGGTGWLLEQVLTTSQPKQVVYLETSAQMVVRSSRRMIRHAVVGSVDFRVGDETLLTSDEHFDVILTPFVLDLYTEKTLQTSFVPALRSRLTPGGLWLVTDFVQPQVGWQKALLWTMIRFFRLTADIDVRQLADWQRCLQESKLTLQGREQRVGGMVSSEVWQVN